MKDDFFLSWNDLIQVGSISPYFPEVWTTKEKWLADRATMTAEERCRRSCSSGNLHPELKLIFDKYKGVFSEDLSNGRRMNVPMDIRLDEDMARKYRGHYSTSVRKPPICMEGAAAKLMDELLAAGIIARCEGPVDFLARVHFVMKAVGERVRLVTDYSTALNPCLKKEHHGFTCAKDIRESQV